MSGGLLSPSPNSPPSFPLPQLPPSTMQALTAGSPNPQGSQAANPSLIPVTTTPSGLTPPHLTVPGPGGASGPSSAATSTITLHRPITASSSNAGCNNKAERKKLCDALMDAGGEIPVLNEDDDTWTVTRFVPLVRSGPSETNSWDDLFGVLTDKYFFLLKEETDPQGTTRHSLVEKPIPLECLCLVPSDEESITRKHDPGFFNRAASCFSPLQTDILYPFTIYHAAARITRRYTLCAESATERNKWRTALSSAIEERNPQHELYSPQTLNDDFFLTAPKIQLKRGVHYTGRVVCAAEFSYEREDYMAIGCDNGIYISKRGANAYRKVLDSNQPISMVAIQEVDIFLVHCESTLYSYSLDMVVRASQGALKPESLINSEQKLGQDHGKILFFQAGRLANRTLIVYGAKSSKESKLHVLEVTDPVVSSPNPPETKVLGTPITIPEDSHDASFYLDKIEIYTSKAIYSIDSDPINTTSPLKPMSEFPTPKGSPNTFQRMLKGIQDKAKSLLRLEKSPVPKIMELVDKANVLGMVRHGNHTLVIYDEFGRFIDGDGKPASPPYFVSWDCTATTYVLQGSRLLLFSPGFIEVRNVDTGALIRVVKGDVLNLRRGLKERGMLIAAMSGGRTEDGAGKEALVELVYNGQ